MKPMIRIANKPCSCSCCGDGNYEGRIGMPVKKADAILELVIGNMVRLTVCPDCLRSLIENATALLSNAEPVSLETEKIRIYSGKFYSEENAESLDIWDDPVNPKYMHGEVVKKLMEELEFIPAADGRECSECEHYNEDTCGGSHDTCPCVVGFDYGSVNTRDSVPGSHYHENASFYYSCSDVEIPASIVARIRASGNKEGK